MAPLVLAASLAAAAADSPKRNFDVPANSADKSLKVFSEQAGLEVIFPSDIAKGIRTRPIKGTMTAREALESMLADTGLKVIRDERTGAFTLSRAIDPNALRAAPPTSSVRPSKNPEETGPGGKEAAVELSPFTVTADQDVGYVPGNTLAGGRLNTSLRDTGASISVLTAEFLSDIGATDLTDALQWGNNVQMAMSDDGAIGAAPNDNNFFNPAPTFRVRGIAATVTRNYFEWAVPIDMYNIDRVEEARGPNSILFGIGSAGGILNASTKQALTNRSFWRGDLGASSFGGYRGSLDVNQSAFNHKLGVRVNALYDHTGSFRTYGYSTKRRLDVAAKYQLTSTTRLRAEFETGTNHEAIGGFGVIDGLSPWLAAGRPTFANPIAANNAIGVARYGTAQRVTFIDNNGTLLNMANQNSGAVGPNMVLDERIADHTINAGGPGQIRSSFFNVFSAFLEQALGQHSFLELAFNHQDSNSRTYQTGTGNGGALTFDPILTLPGGAPNPYGGKLMFDGETVRRLNVARADHTRLSLSTEFEAGRWGKYRLAGLAEYEARVLAFGPQIEVWEGRPFNSAPEAAANQVFRRGYVTEGDWSTYYRSTPANAGLVRNLRDPVTGRTLSSTWVAQNANQNEDPNYQTTLLVGGQARYFRDRLVFGFGFRHDKLDIFDRGSRRNPATQEFEVDYSSATKFSYTGRTRTLGVVGHLTSNLSLLYNRSDNFSLPNATIRVLPDSLPPSSPEGQGQDVGLSLTLLEGRLYARAVYYESSIKGSSSPHGFGSSATSPTAVGNLVLDALVANKLISNAEADSHRVTANGALFDRSSKGYELTLTANPTKNWRLQGNFSSTSSFEENIGREVLVWANTILPYFRKFDQNLATTNGTIADVIARFESAMADQFALEGEDVGGNRKFKVSLFTRYGFSSGPLKGFFVGGGYRHQSKNVAGRNGAQGDFIYGPSYWVADALAGYRLSRFRQLKHVTVQLNVGNVFNEDKPLVTTFNDNGSVRRWVPFAPRTWRLNVSTEF